ncbi:hypothetical protein C8R47DRAFT_1140105, partial [Mycena vitilis]
RVYIHKKSRYIEHTCRARATRSSNTTAGLLMRASPSAANRKPRRIHICCCLLGAVGPAMLDDFRRVLGGLVSSMSIGSRRGAGMNLHEAKRKSQKWQEAKKAKASKASTCSRSGSKRERKKKSMVRKRLGKEKAPGGTGEGKGFLPVDLAKQHQLSPNLEVSNLGVKDDQVKRGHEEKARAERSQTHGESMGMKGEWQRK